MVWLFYDVLKTMNDEQIKVILYYKIGKVIKIFGV